MDGSTFLAGSMMGESILKYCFMLIIANLQLSYYIDLIIGKFYFRLSIYKTQYLYDQVLMYMQQNNSKILYKKNGKLTSVSRLLDNEHNEVPVHNEINNNYISGDSYSVIRVGRNLYSITDTNDNCIVTTFWGG